MEQAFAKGRSLDIALVVAVAENGVIGVDGDLPWRLSSDMRHFRSVTMGKPVIMGRKTWISIGKPLAGRTNIVVSRNTSLRADGAHVAGSLDEAFQIAAVHGMEEAGEACVIGGGQIYAEALGIADRLYVTHVMARPEGDTRFPPIAESEWEAIAREEMAAGERDSAAMAFVTYERRRKPAGG